MTVLVNLVKNCKCKYTLENVATSDALPLEAAPGASRARL